MQNQPGSDLVLADCVRFWPNGSGPETSWCPRNIRPASGQCFPADPDWMRIRSSICLLGRLKLWRCVSFVSLLIRCFQVIIPRTQEWGELKSRTSFAFKKKNLEFPSYFIWVMGHQHSISYSWSCKIFFDVFMYVINLIWWQSIFC